MRPQETDQLYPCKRGLLAHRGLLCWHHQVSQLRKWLVVSLNRLGSWRSPKEPDQFKLDLRPPACPIGNVFRVRLVVSVDRLGSWRSRKESRNSSSSIFGRHCVAY